MPLPIILALAAAAPQTAAPACPATPVALSGDLAGWAHARTVTAAAKTAGIDATMLQPGVRADVTLLPAAQISWAGTPAKPVTAGSYGGLLGYTAARAGTYRVALGAGAWIDLLGADGKALASAAHAHGPDCSGIRKVVDFQLQPGRYVVQISGAPTPAIGVLVAAKA